MPNSLWIKSDGWVLTVPLIIVMDDVSGNIFKQWNRHYIIYMSNTLTPHGMLKKDLFCFVCIIFTTHNIIGAHARCLVSFLLCCLCLFIAHITHCMQESNQ
ncbi:hypothetical protein PAXRUDRAFT_172431 [Paxillus rubicundulus Ve08.2h10]|uniref:Uncharacterized protein n=1 Tax=Paxillus rubicundulus Ve08.2h10 TaxID=930991 RepID=A0A0D0CWU0_9AGAM|nr:hypothetical protein PAXRUDRAFT_172431 [Paxillus rubicundulus Ve08.2h10]